MSEQGKKKVFITFKDKANIGQNLTVYLASIFKKEDEAGPGSMVCWTVRMHIWKKYFFNCEGIVNTKRLMCSAWGAWRIAVLQYQKPGG